MTKSRIFQVFASLALVVFFVCGQQAPASESRHHLQVRVVPGTQQSAVKAPTGFDELFQLSYGFGALPPLDGSGYDEWPCDPSPANPNYPDCSNIASGGVVIGTPAYTVSLSACNANSPTSTNCGQIFWFYEDDTNDNTDDLIVSIVVKQGSNFILDTGSIDLGPNPNTPGSVVVISEDVAFGTLGETGKNNGYCGYYEKSNKICSDPLQGIAVVTISTKVGPSKIMKTFDINLQ
jgi:hypothetical protein